MLRNFYNQYKHLFPAAFLLGGFVLDVVTFRTLQPSTTFLLLGGYALAAAACVIVGDRIGGRLKKFVPLITQFAFGALLSQSLLFYWFGGSVAASWPAILVVVAMMGSNEAFRAAFLRPAIQYGVFAFVFFSYCTLLFPFILLSVSAWVFLLGGVVATGLSLLVAEAASRVDVSRRPLKKRMQYTAGGVFATFMALYFLNVIPPIPLSIRDAGFYHDVRVTAGEYMLAGEPQNIFQQLWPGQTLHVEQTGDKRFYAFTAIYAPNSLATTIVHHWQRYDETTAKWVDNGKSSYTTRGGRAEGFRGYSYRTIEKPGDWRVIVESARGQELGRIYLDVRE